MKQPKGYEELGKEKWVWRLKKALYGLKQGGREWYATLDEFFTSMGFARCESNHCVYVARKESSTIIVPVYVDDLLIGYNNIQAMHEIRDALAKQFKMVDMGNTHWILGMELKNNVDCGVVSINQTQYVSKVLARYGMSDCKPVSTPLPENLHLELATDDDDVKQASSFPYLEAIGSLMYAMLGTRPNLAFAVGLLSRYSSRPGMQHVTAVKHVFCYLRGTLDWGISYTRSGGGFVGYTDSDWADNRPTRKSTSGGVFMLAGGPVSWQSKLQSVVALSSTEAEYLRTIPTTNNVADLCTKALGKIKLQKFRSDCGMLKLSQGREGV